ncbi:hypothetical protein D3C87_1798040 [compost metagenome]
MLHFPEGAAVHDAEPLGAAALHGPIVAAGEHQIIWAEVQLPALERSHIIPVESALFLLARPFHDNGLVIHSRNGGLGGKGCDIMPHLRKGAAQPVVEVADPPGFLVHPGELKSHNRYF